MLFRSIELHNFGRYAGTNTIDTGVTEDRNVILIRANNDRGKTTLFRAVMFALYGDGGLPDGSKASRWPSMQVAAKGDGEMYVEIAFEHEGNAYLLRRHARFAQTPAGEEIILTRDPELTISKDGRRFLDTYDQRDRQEWVDSILPLDASQFFLFDGEEIQRYTQHESAHVREAIEKVLGLRELVNAKEDLARIRGDLDSEYHESMRRHAKDEGLQKDLERIHAKISRTDADIADTGEEIDRLTSAKARVAKRQQAYGKIAYVSKQRDEAAKELIQSSQQLDKYKQKLTRARGSLGLVLSSGLLDVIAAAAAPDADGGRDAAGRDAQPSGWRLDAMRRLADDPGDDCLCGRPMDEHVRGSLRSRLAGVGRPTRASSMRQLAADIRARHDPASKRRELEDCSEWVADTRDNMDRLENRKRELDEEMGEESDTPDLEDLDKEYRETDADITLYKQKLANLAADRDAMIKKREKLERKIDAGAASEQLALSKRRAAAGTRVLECVSRCIDLFYEKRKPQLESAISQTFSMLTNNPGMYNALRISDDFGMRVVLSDGSERPTDRYSPSAGASQIIATSMIGGLNRFSTRDAPVVIDTPMGRLDPIHRKKLVDYYPAMGRQIIILYQPSELGDDDIRGMSDHLASEWEIEPTGGGGGRNAGKKGRGRDGGTDTSRIRMERSYLG